MKKCRIILIVMILVFITSILFKMLPTEGTTREATLEDLIVPGREKEIYKYAFWLDQYLEYDNLFCIRKGGSMKRTWNALKSEGVNSKTLHRLTTYVKINGNKAQYYAAQGHRDVINGKIERGTLLHESVCEENNLMAAILTEGRRLGK